MYTIVFSQKLVVTFKMSLTVIIYTHLSGSLPIPYNGIKILGAGHPLKVLYTGIEKNRSGLGERLPLFSFLAIMCKERNYFIIIL